MVVEHNKKTILPWNILHLVEDSHMFDEFYSNDIKPRIVMFRKALVRDIFWYLDGYHFIIAERAVPIPSVFQGFSGYNMPHLSIVKEEPGISPLTSLVIMCNHFALFFRIHWDQPHWKEPIFY